MSTQLSLTPQEITDFLGNIDFQMITVRHQWQIYMDTSRSQPDRNTAKQKAIDAIVTIQKILNTVKTPMQIILPTDDLSDTEIISYGIMPI